MGNSYQDNLAAAARISHIAPLGSLREKVANLSSEQRQLVAIARVLVGAPRLVVVDEPTIQLGQTSNGAGQTLISIPIRLCSHTGPGCVG